NDGGFEILRLARALDGNTLRKIVHPLRILIQHSVLFGAKPAGSETVHCDSVLAPIVGKAHGELADTAAACAISSETGVTRNASDGADVDNAAVAARNHAARDRLRYKKTAAQICIENCVPVVPGNIKGGLANVAAGIVDQNIEMAEFPFGRCGHLFDAF